MPLYLIILLLSLPLAARAETTEEPSPDHWYDIEVLIFTQQSGSGEGEEHQEVWPLDPGSPDLKQVIELAPAPAQDQDPNRLMLPFAMRPESAWRLGTEDRRIRAGRDYTLLSHLAWRQPAPPSETALPVHIRIVAPTEPGAGDGNAPADAAAPIEAPANDLAPTPPGAIEPEQVTERPAEPVIEGIIRISRNNYLHVDADLLYRAAESNKDGLPAILTETSPIELPPTLISPDGADSTLSAEQVTPIDYRMRQSRRVRKEALNFFDHPRFGLLIRIDPVEPPSDPPPANK